MISKNTGSDVVHSTSEDNEIDFSLVPFSMDFHDPDPGIWHAYMDAVPSMLLVLDTNQVVSFVSEHFCKGLHYTKQEIIGHIWYEILIAPGKRYEARKTYAKPAEYVIDDHGVELPIMDKHGQELPAILRVGYIQDRNGNITGIIAQIEMVNSAYDKYSVCSAADKYRVLVENSADMIVATDTAGVVIYISPSIVTYGFIPEEVILKELSDLFFLRTRARSFTLCRSPLINPGRPGYKAALKTRMEKYIGWNCMHKHY